MSEQGCICQGNWRTIVRETRPLIGRQFRGRDGKVYTLFGVVDGEDDYYYGMCRIDTYEARLLSCVGSIEGHGYSLLEKA